MEGWLEVFRSEDTLISQIKASLLKEYGIQTMLTNEHYKSIGTGGITLPCCVFVQSFQYEQALQVLIEHDNSTEDSIEEPTHCPKCSKAWEKGFWVCWNCEFDLNQ